MAEISTPLQKKPWKVWMSARPEPVAVLTTIRDLLNGTNLEHDIMIYNGNLYSNGVFSGSNFEDFAKYCFDMSPVLFDSASKAKPVKINLNQTYSGFGTQLSENLGISPDVTFYYQDKDAALYPEDIRTMFASNNTWKGYFRQQSTLLGESVGNAYQLNEFFTIAEKRQDDEDERDFIILDEDKVFSATMIFEDGKKAYTKLQLNRKISDRMYWFIAGAVLYNSSASNVVAYNTKLYQAFTDTQNDTSKQTLDFVKKWVDALIAANKDENDILAHVYVWIKAPFAGDYVDPKDFNQDLNQDSNVVFANILVANDYAKARNDFNRYRQSTDFSGINTSIDEYLEKATRPYCPTNSPIKDFLSDGLVSEIKENFRRDEDVSSTEGLESDALAVIKDSYELSPVTGSVLVVPGSSAKQSDKTTRYTPFNFYDPESREDAEYYKSLGRIPTLLRNSGNFTTDGRIMSPTIDELWYVIKKLISGNRNQNDERLSLLAGESYQGDTSLTEVPKVDYNFNVDKKTYRADPIDFKFSYDGQGNVSGINPLEWVAQPSKVSHKVFNYIKQYSKTLNTFFDAQNIEEQNTRRIENTGDDLVINDSFELGNIDREHGPRSSAPLSLRELEAAMLGNKYNIDNNFIFSTKTYAVTGKFGKKEEDDDGNIISAGSIYQLHRDYNAKVDKPNTWFKLKGTGKADSEGMDATCGDLDGEVEMNGNINVYVLDGKHKRTTITYDSKLPKLVKNYGKSKVLLERQGQYRGSNVYMAADGTWRYNFEHVRIPILRSRY